MHFAINVALVLSILAFIPSAAAFTPAIVVSALAAVIAVFAIRAGHIRRAVLTIYFAVCAFIVSPIIFEIGSVDRYLVAFSGLGIVCAGIMYWQYRRG